MREKKDLLFSLRTYLPLLFFSLAFAFLNRPGVSFYLGISVPVLIFSCRWGFKSLLVTSLFSLVFLYSSFSIVSWVFFSSIFTSCCLVVLFQKLERDSMKSLDEQISRLTAWSSHYEAFQEDCEERIQGIKNAQKEIFFLKEELERLEKEKRDFYLEEDFEKKSLMDLLSSSQNKCADLQKEVEILEELLLQSSVPLVKPTRKKRKKEEIGQPTLF